MAGAEIFLLRNLSSGKGVGFYETSGFYPDFILWIKEGDAQRIVFIEPHGMLHENAYTHDAKAQLHERLPDLAAKMARPNVSLDSFIISATPYLDLYKRYDSGEWTPEQFAQKHILFPEQDGDYVARIIGCVQS